MTKFAPYENEADVVEVGNLTLENRLDLTASALTIEDRGFNPTAVAWTPRIGIRVAVDRPWRCWISGNRSVSGTRTRA